MNKRKFLPDNEQNNNDLNLKNHNLNMPINDLEDFKSCEYVKTLLDSVKELETDCTRMYYYNYYIYFKLNNSIELI